MSGGPRQPSRSADDRRRALASGHEAESWVAGELEAQGWVVLDRNVRIGNGELDLVVLRDRCLRFVEVKARADGADGLEAVTPWKQGKLRRAAEAWMQHDRRGGYDEVAFLVAVVSLGGAWSLELFDDAF